MKRILVNGKEYTFVKDYKNNELLRKNYNVLTQKIYGFDFEGWYQAGYWWNGYVPYSLLDVENVVANDSVLNFYPKFGFAAISEYQYSKTVTNDNEIILAEKLDMSLDSSRELVVQKVNDSISVAQLSMLKNPGLIMFYCTSFMSGNIYYLKEQDAVVIAVFEGDALYLQDVFSSSEVNLDNIIKMLANKETKRVVLGFTPNDTDGYCANLLKDDNTTLFVMKDKTGLFQNNKLMFPMLSHT